jgi:hypothetical protein
MRMIDKLLKLKKEVERHLGDRNLSLLSDTLCHVIENFDSEERLRDARKAVKGVVNEDDLKVFFFAKITPSIDSWKVFHERLSTLDNEEQKIVTDYILYGKKIKVEYLLKSRSFNLIEETLASMGYSSPGIHAFLVEILKMKFFGKGISNIGRGELFCILFIENAEKIDGKGDIIADGIRIEIKGIGGMYGEQLTRLDSLIKERVSREEIERTGEKVPNWQLSNKGIESISRLMAISNRKGMQLTKEILSCYLTLYNKHDDEFVVSIKNFIEYSRNYREIEIALKDMFSYVFKRMLHDHLRDNQMVMLCLDATNEEKKKGCNRGNAVIFSSENVWEIVKGPYEKGESAVRIIQPSVSSQTGRPSVTI